MGWYLQPPPVAPLPPGVCGGSAGSACFLLAGLPGELASGLAKQLSAKGVAYDHILFAQSDFF